MHEKQERERGPWIAAGEEAMAAMALVLRADLEAVFVAAEVEQEAHCSRDHRHSKEQLHEALFGELTIWSGAVDVQTEPLNKSPAR